MVNLTRSAGSVTSKVNTKSRTHADNLFYDFYKMGMRIGNVKQQKINSLNTHWWNKIIIKYSSFFTIIRHRFRSSVLILDVAPQFSVRKPVLSTETKKCRLQSSFSPLQKQFGIYGLEQNDCHLNL
jgi:hypothetical protein